MTDNTTPTESSDSINEEQSEPVADSTADAEPQEDISADAKAEQPKVKKSDPDWLPKRVEQAKRSAARELGFDDLEAAKAAIAELKKLKDERKSEQERLMDRVKELEAAQEQLVTYKSAIESRAQKELAELDDVRREAVIDLAGDDPAAQLKTIERLRPTWKTAPADTSPAPSAPKPKESKSANLYQQWQSMQLKDPFAASDFYRTHRRDIDKLRPQD